MLESFSEAEIFEAPFARANASWIGIPKAPPVVGLSVTINGTTDAVMGVPLKYMVRIQPKQALSLLSSLIDALGQTDAKDEMERMISPHAPK